MHFTFQPLLMMLLLVGSHAAAQTCDQPRKLLPLGGQIANVALNEYNQFNGHRINADGYLWKFGSVESETESLLDPASGTTAASQSGRYAWRRVWEYWLTLDRHVTGEALSRKVFSVPGLLDNPASTEPVTEIRLRDLFSGISDDDDRTGTALRQSAVRAALNDSPWSATFISYLMDRANLTDQQFRYSSAHWQYVQRAFEQPAGYAYKACDPYRTTPSVGDLLCYSRGSSPLKDFSAWQNAVQQPGFSAASHCEVVVEVDLDAKKFEVIGGNVMQSVARRKLKLNADDVLSDSHHLDRYKPEKHHDCEQDKSCTQQNLNLQYWGVLLQLQ